MMSRGRVSGRSHLAANPVVAFSLKGRGCGVCGTPLVYAGYGAPRKLCGAPECFRLWRRGGRERRFDPTALIGRLRRQIAALEVVIRRLEHQP